MLSQNRRMLRLVLSIAYLTAQIILVFANVSTVIILRMLLLMKLLLRMLLGFILMLA